MQDEEEALLGAAEGAAAPPPAWVATALSWSSFARRVPGKVALTIAYLALWAAAIAIQIRAAQVAGLAVGECAARACLFMIFHGSFCLVEWLAMLFYLGDNKLPSPWNVGRLNREAAHESLSELPAAVIIVSLTQMLPTALWLRGALSEYAPAIPVLLILAVAHNWIAMLGPGHWIYYLGKTQREFTEALTNSEMGYDEAVAAFSSVNACRKVVSRAMERCEAGAWLLFLALQATLLYDFELRPWGGWPLGLCFVANVLSFVLMMGPYVGMNEWPLEVSREVMESRELRWEPSERTNFCAHLSATRVQVCFFGFEMGSEFRTAFPIFFFGWWLYLTELHQFHEFSGFPFDQECGVNSTAPTRLM